MPVVSTPEDEPRRRSGRPGPGRRATTAPRPPGAVVRLPVVGSPDHRAVRGPRCLAGSRHGSAACDDRPRPSRRRAGRRARTPGWPRSARAPSACPAAWAPPLTRAAARPRAAPRPAGLRLLGVEVLHPRGLVAQDERGGRLAASGTGVVADRALAGGLQALADGRHPAVVERQPPGLGGHPGGAVLAAVEPALRRRRHLHGERRPQPLDDLEVGPVAEARGRRCCRARR